MSDVTLGLIVLVLAACGILAIAYASVIALQRAGRSTLRCARAIARRREARLDERHARWRDSARPRAMPERDVESRGETFDGPVVDLMRMHAMSVMSRPRRTPRDTMIGSIPDHRFRPESWGDS